MILSHLIRDHKCKDKTMMSPREILVSILDLENNAKNPVLKATKTSWYSTSSGARVFNHSEDRFETVKVPQAVCFTEATFGGLGAHRQVFEAKYGLAFDRDFLMAKGANPCINLTEIYLRARVPFPDSKSYKVYNCLPESLRPFVNVVNERFDPTSEREWRIPHDLEFDLSDVHFIFCPKSEFSIFSRFQKKGFPILFDLDWLGVSF